MWNGLVMAVAPRSSALCWNPSPKRTDFAAQTVQTDDQDVGGGHAAHRLLAVDSKLQGSEKGQGERAKGREGAVDSRLCKIANRASLACRECRSSSISTGGPSPLTISSSVILIFLASESCSRWAAKVRRSIQSDRRAAGSTAGAAGASQGHCGPALAHYSPAESLGQPVWT